MKVFYYFYRRFFSFLVSTPVLKWLGVSARRIEEFRHPSFLKTPAAKEAIAFHAASAGELEILLPLIGNFIAQKTPVVVTAFSDSALPTLQKISGAVFAGLSPGEDQWGLFFDHFQVQKIFISKYEAWPALWIECQKRDIPLVLLNAQMRSSLIWAKRLILFFGHRLPRLFLFANEVEQEAILRRQFPTASVSLSPDPRWMRVHARKLRAAQHPKVLTWKLRTQELPWPFGMVGSAWIEDLKLLVPAFQKQAMPGTLWVVPHSLQPEKLDEIRAYLTQELPGRFVLVDEMGFLAELYSLADWVWVGGGFGKGVHSTLEPAVYDKPIGCGPYRAQEFLEIRELTAAKILTICCNQAEIEKWLGEMKTLPDLSHSSTRLFQIEKKIADFPHCIEQWEQIR